MCLRPQSAGSTIPRLRPTGSSLGIAPVDYDPVVLHKPFGPRLAAGALPSRASSMGAPGRPIRAPAFAVVPHEPLHTFHPLWPVRHYPHLRISVRGPGPSGTSTHLTRQLPGTHDATIRLLNRHGVEVVSPKGEGCCGALVHHMGRDNEGHGFAKRNIDAWIREMDGEGLDGIVISASGCGTTIKDYGFMFP